MKTPRPQAYAMVELETGGQFVSALDDASRPDFRKLFKGHAIRKVTIGRTKTQVMQAYPVRQQKSKLISTSHDCKTSGLGARVYLKQPQGQKSPAKHVRDHLRINAALTVAEPPVEAVIRSFKHYLSPADWTVAFPPLDPECSPVVIESADNAMASVTSLADLLSGEEESISGATSDSGTTQLAEWLQQPAPTPSEVAAQRLRTLSALREEIRAAVPMLSAAEIARAAGSSTRNPRVYGQRLREQSALAVRDANSFRFPAFQFLENGKLHPRMKDVLQVIHASRSPEEIDDGWPTMIWMYAPTGLLAGRRPMDVFVDDAEAVVTAAIRQFGSARADA